MFTGVSDILEKYVKKDDTVIVGVSGGPDSTALLDCMVRYAKKTPCKIVVAHVNHSLRGRASDKDEIFTRDLVKKYSEDPFLSIRPVFRGKRIFLKNGAGVEMIAREKRRDFFKKLQERYGAKWILTAHHADDNTESVILHFLRGAGPGGLVGMEEAKNGYLRPMLGITKREILRYCKSRKLSFRKDRTNRMNVYRRNFLRNKIMPLLLKINPSIGVTIKRNGIFFRDINIFLEREAVGFLDKRTSLDDNRRYMHLFSLRDFMVLPDALKKTVIQESFKRANGSHYKLSMVMINAILNMIIRGIGNKRVGSTKTGFFVLRKGKIFYACNPRRFSG